MAYVDLSTFTEVDTNGHLSRSATRETAAAVTRQETCYAYKDYTADHFDALDIDVTVYNSSASSSDGNFAFAVTNTLNNLKGAASSDLEVGLVESGGKFSIFLVRGNLVAYDSWLDVGSLNTPYYLTLTRAAGNDTATLKIYDDAARTNLLDTLTVSGFGSVKWRYLLSGQSINDGNIYAYSGYNENIDLNGAAATTTSSTSTSTSSSTSSSSTTSSSTTTEVGATTTSSSSTSSSTSTSTSTSTSSSTSSSSTSSSSTTTWPFPADKLHSRESISTLATSNDTNLSTVFSSYDYVKVATDNNVYVDQSASSGYSEFLFKNKNDVNDDKITPTWKGKSDRDCALSTCYLQIFNRTTTSWETIDSDSTTGVGTEFILTAEVTLGVSNYYDVDFWVSCRVWQRAI